MLEIVQLIHFLDLLYRAEKPTIAFAFASEMNRRIVWLDAVARLL